MDENSNVILQAVKNTFILVAVTVPISTALALVISVALNSVEKLRELAYTDMDAALKLGLEMTLELLMMERVLKKWQK